MNDVINVLNERSTVNTAIFVDNSHNKTHGAHLHVKLSVNVKDDWLSWWVIGVFRTMCAFSVQPAPSTFWSEPTLDKLILPQRGERLMGERMGLIPNQVVPHKTECSRSRQKAVKWAKWHLMRNCVWNLTAVQVRQGSNHFRRRGFPLAVKDDF